MSPVQEAALRDGLSRAFAIDPDIATLPVFANITKSVKVLDNGEVDPASVRNAINEMKKARPALFQVVNYEDLTSEEFDKQEMRLRDQLRKPRDANRVHEFRNLDCATLSDEEMAALRRYLSGNRNTWDRAVLVNAQRRQSSFGPEAA